MGFLWASVIFRVLPLVGLFGVVVVVVVVVVVAVGGGGGVGIVVDLVVPNHRQWVLYGEETRDNGLSYYVSSYIMVLCYVIVGYITL